MEVKERSRNEEGRIRDSLEVRHQGRLGKRVCQAKEGECEPR